MQALPARLSPGEFSCAFRLNLLNLKKRIPKRFDPHFWDYKLCQRNTRNPPSDWSTSEVHYFSDHMNGIYNYYHFAINAGETKVFTIGFFVDEVLLENGELLLPVNSGQGYIQILAMEPE